MISSRYEIKENAPSRAQRLAKKGDVFYQTVRPYQRNNYLFDKEENNYVFSTGYAQLRPNCNSRYLLNLLQTDSFVNIVLNNCTGTSYPAINSSDLGNIHVTTTKNIREQTKIGEIFYRLDNLITLHQRKPKLLCSSQNFYLVSEYAHPWEQRKLFDIADFKSGQGLSLSDISKEGTQECILYGNLYTDYGMIITSVRIPNLIQLFSTKTAFHYLNFKLHSSI